MSVLIFQNASTMEALHCANCGLQFAMPRDFLNRFRDSRETFYCPSGHPNVFKKSTEDVLRERISEAQAVANNLRNTMQYYERRVGEVGEELKKQKFKTMGERSAKLRLKKRIANGVCPCCQRSFANLGRHMAHMHPKFANEEAS